MKQCPKCSTLCQDYDNACSNCGTFFNSENAANNQVSQNNYNSNDTNNTDDANNVNNPNNINNANDANNPNNINNTNNFNLQSESRGTPYTNYLNNMKIVKTNGMAIASLVLGVGGFVLCCWFTLIPGILAVIFGFI